MTIKHHSLYALPDFDSRVTKGYRRLAPIGTCLALMEENEPPVCYTKHTCDDDHVGVGEHKPGAGAYIFLNYLYIFGFLQTLHS